MYFATVSNGSVAMALLIRFMNLKFLMVFILVRFTVRECGFRGGLFIINKLNRVDDVSGWGHRADLAYLRPLAAFLLCLLSLLLQRF